MRCNSLRRVEKCNVSDSNSYRHFKNWLFPKVVYSTKKLKCSHLLEERGVLLAGANLVHRIMNITHKYSSGIYTSYNMALKCVVQVE